MFAFFRCAISVVQVDRRFSHRKCRSPCEQGNFYRDLLTWKCVSRHNGVHFFDISTSRSGPRPSVFDTFDMGNVLRATTACNFLSLIWPAGSAPAALASLFLDRKEPQTHWKNIVNRDLPTFSCVCIFFFALFLFSDLVTSSLLLSDSSHLCLSICPYCRKFAFYTSFENTDNDFGKRTSCSTKKIEKQTRKSKPQIITNRQDNKTQIIKHENGLEQM